MVVLKHATYTTRCPFSKTLIKPTNKICLFNEEQMNAFEKIVNEQFINRLPKEIIKLIVEKTGYNKLIGQFGHAALTHWTIKYTKSGRKNVAPLRFGNDRTYVKGSGFKGCDQYDRGYNGWEKNYHLEDVVELKNKKEIREFIVKDEEYESEESDESEESEESDESDESDESEESD